MKNLKEINNYSILELINYIIDNFHIPLRKDLIILESITEELYNKDNFKKDIALPREIFKQFKQEILNHINQEENEFFPEIINLENWTLNNSKIINKFLHIQEIEHNEINNYLIWWKKIIDNFDWEIIKEYKELLNLVNKIHKDTLDHIYVENNYLNTKVEELKKNLEN